LLLNKLGWLRTLDSSKRIEDQQAQTIDTICGFTRGRPALLEQMLQKLYTDTVITSERNAALSELRRALNQASHGFPVEAAASRWIKEVGPLLLARLDELAERAKT